MKKYLPHISILTAGILWGMIGLFNRHLLAFGEPLTAGVALGLGRILISVYILR